MRPSRAFCKLTSITQSPADDEWKGTYLENVPGGSTGVWVHARGRLVKEHDFGVANECDRNREFAFHATGQRTALHVDLFRQAHLRDDLADSRINLSQHNNGLQGKATRAERM